MAHLDHNNPFQAWILSPQEVLQGQVLTSLQKQVIQNERAALANERIMLKFDPEHPLNFQQRDAELQGQILLLTHMLFKSESAEIEINGGRPNQIVINTPSQE
jgi:hypothetical protein